MHLAWDCRSVAPHMGGIGQATIGWLAAFLRMKPANWSVSAIFSSICTPELIKQWLSEYAAAATIHFVDAGLVDPRFEQFRLPVLLDNIKADLYFNTCFTLPSVKTTRWQAAVIHDLVFWEHPEWVEPRLGAYLSQGSALSLARADLVFTVSNFSKNTIYQYLNSDHGCTKIAPDRVRILYPCISAQLLQAVSSSNNFQPRGALSIEKPYILYLGSIEEKKGIKTLLQGYKIFKNIWSKECPRLVLAGGRGGQAFKLEDEFRTLALGAYVSNLGAVSESQKYKLLRESSLFVFPSHYEGFGIPPLEAMAFGVPVVASDAASLPEILGDAALFAKAGCANDLADKMRVALENQNLRKVLVERGRKQATSFSWSAQSTTLINSFKNLLAT